MLDLYEELKAVIAKLNEAQIDYALCGGLALAIHGIPRATVDIDILIQKESLEKVQILTRGLGYIIKAEPMSFAQEAVEIHRVSKIDPEGRDLLSIDFLLVTSAIKPIWENRQKVEWEEGKLWVVSREGLIRLKSLRGSGQDLDDIQKLKEGTDEG
ncbi:MAG: hypothetical protein Q7W38_09245 [Deltaproteobacteria bacterium]|nr:hypothetical protein [Deltaproteobacteria bacterium]